MCFAPQQRGFAPQRRALFRHLNFQKWSENCVFCTFWLGNVLGATTACTFSTSQLPKVVRTWCVLYIFTGNVLRATTACTFSTSQLPKVVQTWCVLYILTWKCASRHNGVHFFQHLNFQKWSEHGVFCTFWLGNALRATTACNFSFLIWPAGSVTAALASLLFDSPEPQIIGKHSISRLSYLFAHLHFLSSESFSSTLLSSKLSLLSASALLCFSSVHIVGSLTSKLPSIREACTTTPQYYFVLQSKHNALPSTTVYYKLAQGTPQYYFVLQSLHKAHLSTTVYYKACTKHFPVRLSTTKLAQSTSQYYCVLQSQSLNRLLRSTTLYYKACTKHFPALLCTTKLAQTTPQYYFILQTLHKTLPRNTLYYEACKNYFPVLMSITEASSTGLVFRGTPG